MREILSKEIEEKVCSLLMDAHVMISGEILDAVKGTAETEELPRARNILQQLSENYGIACRERIPICQDSGMTLVYAEIGQEVHILGDLEEAVNAGVRKAHQEGYLRRSVVRDPLFDRTNTGDGTPTVLQVKLAPGDQIRITVGGKGFGSENCSKLQMFLPTAPLEEIKQYIVDTVLFAGAKSCPPVIVGVGIGGTMDLAAQMAKRATFREIHKRNSDARYAALEEELLGRINESGIGPAGLGGRTTALAVNIEHYATHIAGLPVAVNLCCHASRHKTGVI